MTCQAAEELILKLPEGELALAEREPLDAHLHSCAECRQSWEEHRRLAQMVRRWASRGSLYEVSNDAFTANLLAKIDDRPQTVNSALWMPLLFVALTVATLLVYCTSSFREMRTLSDLACVVPDWISANLISLLTQMPGTWQSAALEVHLPSWSFCLLLGMLLLNTLFYSRAILSRKGSLI